MDGWNTSFLLGWCICRTMLVSGRVPKSTNDCALKSTLEQDFYGSRRISNMSVVTVALVSMTFPKTKIIPPSGQQQNIKNISKYFKINFQTPNSRKNYSNFKFQTNLSVFWETNDSRLTDSHPSFQSSKKRMVWISLLAILVLQGINDQLLTPLQ